MNFSQKARKGLQRSSTLNGGMSSRFRPRWNACPMPAIGTALSTTKLIARMIPVARLTARRATALKGTALAPSAAFAPPKPAAASSVDVIIASGEVAAEGTADELLERSGCDSLEDAFVTLIGTEEGLLA